MSDSSSNTFVHPECLATEVFITNIEPSSVERIEEQFGAGTVRLGVKPYSDEGYEILYPRDIRPAFIDRDVYEARQTKAQRPKKQPLKTRTA